MDQRAPDKGEQNSEEANNAGKEESQEEEKALNDVARTTLAIGPKFIEDLDEILIFIWSFSDCDIASMKGLAAGFPDSMAH